MTQQENIPGLISLTASEGHKLHRIGTSEYYGEITVKAEGVIEFEEVPESEKPTFSKEEYDYKVAAMVRERYSESEEFAIQRKFLNSISGQHSQPAEEEFNQYNAFVEECKVRAKEDLTANESALREEYRQLENAGDDADLCLSPGESI